MKKTLVMICLMISTVYASNSDVDTFKVHKDLLNNANVAKDIEYIKKQKNMSEVDWEKMKLRSKCAITAYPLDGSDFKHGAFWTDKETCKVHYSNIIPTSKALNYGVYNGSWMRILKGKQDYAETKIRIEVSNHCYFIGKGAYDDGYLSRKDWRKIDNNTVELNMGLYYAKGSETSLREDPERADWSDIKHKKNSWNVFNSPLNCSEYPQTEKWIVTQKVNGRWIETARQTFYLKP